MIGVDELIEELIEKIIDIYGCTKKEVIREIKKLINQY